MKWLVPCVLCYFLANGLANAEETNKHKNERITKRDNYSSTSYQHQHLTSRRISNNEPQSSRSYPPPPFFPPSGNQRPYHRKNKSQLPPYAVQMEPLVHYSQRDPLYDQNLANLASQPHNELQSKSIRDLQTDHNHLQENYYGAPKQYIDRPVYIKEPEPIIEIIIKDANSTEPAHHQEYLPPIPPKKKKEEVQVFYVKYQKNPDGSGKNSIIYDTPVPALNPVKGEEIDEREEEEQHIPEVYPTSPPATTTIRAIIKPDSETYHADTGIHVTFGGPSHNPSAERYSHDDDIVESAPQPAVSRPSSHIRSFPHEYKAEQRAPQPYRPFNFVQPNQPPVSFKGAFGDQRFGDQRFGEQLGRFTDSSTRFNDPNGRFNDRPSFQPQQPPRAYHQSSDFSFQRQQTRYPPQPHVSGPSSNYFFQPNSAPSKYPQTGFQQNLPLSQQWPRQQPPPQFNRHPGSLPSSSHQTNFAEPLHFNQQPQPSQSFFSSQNNYHQNFPPQPQNNYQNTQYFNQPRPVKNHPQQHPHSSQFQQQSTYQTIKLNDRPLNDLSQRPLSDLSQRPLNDLSQRPLNDLSQRPLNDISQSPINDHPQRPQSAFNTQQSLPSPQNYNAFHTSNPSFIGNQNFANFAHQNLQPQQLPHQIANKPSFNIPPGGELIQSLPKYEQHISVPSNENSNEGNAFKKINYTLYDSNRVSSIRPLTHNYVTSPSPPQFNNNNYHQSYSSTSQRTTTTSTTTTTPKPTVESTTTNLKDLNIELPEEVPDELRNQLLSSGILKNAQISILDYDKVGDIPLSALPPDQLANFYNAGGAQQLGSSSEVKNVVVKPDGSALSQEDPMELKVVHYNPETAEGQELRDQYINENATQTEPVVLNDDTYNKYLPLKVSGAQFPVPDVPQLEGKRINSVVVLAPINYNFYKQTRPTRNANLRDDLELVKNSALKRLLKEPTKENYVRFLEVENAKMGEKQAVVLLVSDNADREIFMYDINTKSVSKLDGQLSKAFVDAAVSNFNEEDVDEESRTSFNNNNKDLYYVETEKAVSKKARN